MKSFDDVIETVCMDSRTHSIPILYVVQVVMVVTDLFRLENKDELSLSESVFAESHDAATARSCEGERQERSRCFSVSSEQ
jgi:hypothetical protein